MPIENDGEIRVVAAVADRQKVILYKEDGDTVTVSQGDIRLQALMDEIIPITSRGEVAVVSLAKFSVYADFEERSKGVVRFYRAKRRALGALLGTTDPTAEIVVVNMEFTPDISSDQLTELMQQVNDHVGPYLKPGNSQEPAAGPVLTAVDMEVTSKGKTTKETVVERLEPVTRENSEETLQEDELIVAVIGDTIIPDVDKLRPYILHAVRTNSITAVEAFLRRTAKMIKSRAHSVVDLMRFLQHGDLPLADDGSIIAYKILRRSSKPGWFVDCHTRKVEQRPGSYVCVDEKLVDLSRASECSNGLHVARRAYLRNFDGDVCMLIKVAPEDVMVVPHGDPNKVRTKGYHILFQLDDESFRVLKANQPMTVEQKSQAQLFKAIRGDHTPPIERVLIRAQQGGDVLITSLVPEGSTPNQKKRNKASQLDENSRKRASAFDDPNHSKDRIEPREINKRVNAEYAKTSGNQSPSRIEQMEKLFETYRDAKTPEERQKAAQQAVIFKRQSKIAWDKLGIAKAVADQLIKVAGGEVSTKPTKAKSQSVETKKESKAERDARIKREKRSAEKLKKSSSGIPENQTKAGKTKGGDTPTKVAEYKDTAKNVLSAEQKSALDLIRSGVSQSEVAEKLGISRRTIGRWVEKYGT